MPGRVKLPRGTKMTWTPNANLIRLEKSLAAARVAEKKAFENRVRKAQMYIDARERQEQVDAFFARAKAAENRARAKARQEQVDAFFARAKAAENRARAKARQEQVDAFFARAKAAENRARARMDPRIVKINDAFRDARAAIEGATSLANMKKALMKGRTQIHPNKHLGARNYATIKTQNLVGLFDKESKKYA